MLYIAPVVAKCKRAQQSMYLSQLTSPSFSITVPVHGKNGMGESNVGSGPNAQPSRAIRTNSPHDCDWLMLQRGAKESTEKRAGIISVPFFPVFECIMCADCGDCGPLTDKYTPGSFKILVLPTSSTA
jgi:hypothetical protein